MKANQLLAVDTGYELKIRPAAKISVNIAQAD